LAARDQARDADQSIGKPDIMILPDVRQNIASSMVDGDIQWGAAAIDQRAFELCN